MNKDIEFHDDTNPLPIPDSDLLVYQPKTHFILAGGTPEQWLEYLDKRIAILEARNKEKKRRNIVQNTANIISIAALSLGMYLWLTDSWWSAGFCFMLAIIGRCGALYYKGLQQ